MSTSSRPFTAATNKLAYAQVVTRASLRPSGASLVTGLGEGRLHRILHRRAHRRTAR